MNYLILECETVKPTAIFDQYPWAANHNDAITWLTSYIDRDVESVIKQFDDRILQKVAKQHLFSAGFAIR